jgi:hypothetical protein
MPVKRITSVSPSVPPATASPLLSRVVTCYRQWSYVQSWIRRDELFAAPHTEWIVVNDCPRDKPSEALAAQLQARGVQVITPPANLGRSGARNRAATMARGEWLDFVDGDDGPLPFDPSFLVGIKEDIVSVPVRLAQAGHDFEKPGDAPLHRAGSWDELLPRFAPVDVAPSAVLWRRDSFLDLGGFDGRFDGAEDLQMMFRAAETGLTLARHEEPKQCYFLREGRRTFEPQHIFSHRRALQYIANEASAAEVRESAKRWLGKEMAYEVAAVARSTWRQRRLLLKYIGFRLRTLL